MSVSIWEESLCIYQNVNNDFLSVVRLSFMLTYVFYNTYRIL